MGQPLLLLLRWVLLALGFISDAARLNGFFAFVDGAIEIGIGCYFFLSDKTIDGMRSKESGIIVVVGLFHFLKSLLVCLLAVEEDVVFGGQSVHTACKCRIALA